LVTYYVIKNNKQSSMVQWLGSQLFTLLAGVRFPVGEISFVFPIHVVQFLYEWLYVFGS
jgi:hypothetical protein